MFRLHLRGTAREIAAEFARTCFDEPRQVDPESFNEITHTDVSLEATFRLIGGRSTYRLVGRPPGVWDVTVCPTAD